jgi:hypothetical protein
LDQTVQVNDKTRGEVLQKVRENGERKKIAFQLSEKRTDSELINPLIYIISSLFNELFHLNYTLD